MKRVQAIGETVHVQVDAVLTVEEAERLIREIQTAWNDAVSARTLRLYRERAAANVAAADEFLADRQKRGMVAWRYTANDTPGVAWVEADGRIFTRRWTRHGTIFDNITSDILRAMPEGYGVGRGKVLHRGVCGAYVGQDPRVQKVGVKALCRKCGGGS